MTSQPRILALSGGVGGARFLDGLAQVVDGASLTAIVNTGDDFVHLGLSVSPDLDTVMYTLSGVGDEERGWGLTGETFAAMSMIARYGGPDWFGLGDRDLATHLLRTEALRNGTTLTEVTARLCSALGISARILPMADAPRATMIETETAGTLSFQDWFVRLRAAPRVRSVRFEGATRPAAGLLAAIAECDLVFIGPSNPYVSVDPILTLDGVREALSRKRVVAVSPIVGGRAVKGPLATMIPELTGAAPSAGAIAKHYEGLVSAMIVERGDEASVSDMPVLATATVMRGRADRARLAREAIAFALQSATR